MCASESKPVLPGAEPFSAPGGPHGALVLHGFTGNCNSMRGIAPSCSFTDGNSRRSVRKVSIRPPGTTWA